MAELPVLSDYEQMTLKWVLEKVHEGETLLQQEPTYSEIGSNIEYVMGRQLGNQPKELSKIVDNRTKKVVLEEVAALTDIHPLFGFQTANKLFDQQSLLLDKLTRAWWVNTFADLRLADTIKYSAGAGVGYTEVNFDASLAGGQGDLVLTPVDPRDVLPISPKYDFSVQSWGGVIIRSMETVDTLKRRYGVRAEGLTPDRGQGAFGARVWGGVKSLFLPMASAVDVANSQKGGHNIPTAVAAKEVFKVYVKDHRLHGGTEPVIMGEPGTTWSYKVYPLGFTKPDGKKASEEEARLYPRGRLIVACRDRILYDGPNPYWHGLFPIAKLCLEPWPWSLLGGSLVSDLKPIQDAINQILNGVWDHVQKTLAPTIVGDKRAVPDSVWNRFNSRIPNQKLKQNPTAGDPLQFISPEPLPPDVYKFMEWALNEMDVIGGTAGLQQLAALKQMPGADTIEAYKEALTPILRNKGRVMEVFLREIGEMVKSGFFQFYNLPRRVAILGESGIDLEDFDFDPGSLIPAMSENDEGYTPELDYRKSTPERAIYHCQNFTFQIAPNSLLAISQLSRKLTYMQLFTRQLMDPWSLWEALEIPNAGAPPEGVTTISERIVAAQMMGLMPPPAGAMMGRPPSGGQAPELQEKTDPDGVPRTTLSESG